MHVSVRSLTGLAAGAVLLLAGPSLPDAHADATKGGAQVTVTLTNGLVLQGMDRREGKFELQEDGVEVFMPSGFFFLDDMPRRQYFSASLMQTVAPKAETTEDKILAKYHDIRIIHPRSVPAVQEVLSVGAWDEKWGRDVKFRGDDGKGLRDWTVNQRLAVLTPYYAYTLATDIWNWPAMYLTRELGPDTVRNLLSSHPDFQLDNNLAPADRVARHFRYCDFFAQAGWYDESERELNRMLAENPSDDVKQKAEATRAALNRLRGREWFETVKQQHNAGEFQTVRKALANFNDKTADPVTAAAVAAKRDEYAAGDKALADATRFLDELPKHLGGGARDATLAEAAATIRGELELDNLFRLEAFLGQARQAERDVAAGRTPSVGPAEQLSLAVTSWMGSLASPDPAAAVKIWGARQFVQKYLTSASADRKALLRDYLSREDAAGVDDFTRIIPLLPPPEPEEKISDEAVTVKTGKGRNTGSYLLQLPPEYRHSRNYPVLIVLHDAGETPEDMLKRWRDPAADNGYILVAPEWNVTGSGYGYTETEHATVLETLHDLRRRFAVDSDRVFLFGLGWGGAMAFDVGLSHPDLFAGVLPMSAGPRIFSERYYPNAQHLPFFIVSGDRSGDVNKHLREQFTYWASKYPAVWIQYKGRGLEWYGGEVSTMFDWMRGQRRELPLQDIGLGRPFAIHRATDNRFYWLTTDGVANRCINSAAGWDTTIKPATLEGRIDLENNTIWVQTAGLSQVTVWLGRNGKNEPMVDLTRPLTVKWNSNAVWNKQTVAPSLATLLEDLADRGDRQRLFVAKLEFQGK